MAVDDHMKIASAELAKAADLLKQEITRLRNDEVHIKQTVALQITQLTDQMKTTQHQINSAIDTNHSNQLNVVVRQIQSQINDKKHELNDQIKRIQDMIREKENAANAVQQQARNVSP